MEKSQFSPVKESCKNNRTIYHNGLNYSKSSPFKKVQLTSEVTESLDSIKQTALELADDTVRYAAGFGSVGPPSKYAETMRRTVTELMQRHEYLFNGMTKKLRMSKTNVTTVLHSIFVQIFADGQYNWGRIVTVYAFAGWVANSAAKNDMEDCVLDIGKATGTYVAETLSPWIQNDQGWDGFERFFKEELSTEKMFFYGLLCTAVSLGVVALATSLIAR